MRGIKVILAVGAVVTTMVVTAMAQTVLAALVTLASGDSSFDGGGFIGSDGLSFSKR